LGAQLLLASIMRSAPVVRKTQAWIMSPWALVPVMLSAHTAASANLWRTMIFSIEAPPCCLYIHAGFYRDKDGRKAGLFRAYQSAAWCSFTSNLHARPSSRHVCFALIAPELADGI